MQTYSCIAIGPGVQPGLVECIVRPSHVTNFRSPCGIRRCHFEGLCKVGVISKPCGTFLVIIRQVLQLFVQFHICEGQHGKYVMEKVDFQQ